MPKSPTTARSPLSPRLVSPYSRSLNVPDEGICPPLSDGAKIEARRAIPQVLLLDKLEAPAGRKSIAVASLEPTSGEYYHLTGDFLRTGIHAWSKSARHPVENPLEKKEKNEKKPHWLQIQFNVVVQEESTWTCDMALKKHGGLPCGKDLIMAVQTGGEDVKKQSGKYTITLAPPRDPQDDPRIAISYLLSFNEKTYIQAMDGTLPYAFMISRVTKKGGKRDKIKSIFKAKE